jgi:hypothetical protein
MRLAPFVSGGIFGVVRHSITANPGYVLPPDNVATRDEYLIVDGGNLTNALRRLE